MNINELKKAIEDNNLNYIVQSITHESWSIQSSNPAKNQQLIALQHAIKFNRLVILTHIFMINPGILHKKNQDEQTALMIAAEEGNFDLVQYLVTIGAKVQEFTNERDKLYPIHFAIQRRFSAIAIFLFKQGAPLDLYLSPLIVFAARFSDLDTVKYLYEENPLSLNQVDRSKQSALLWASANGHIELVKYLLERKAITEFATMSGHNYPSLDLANCYLKDIKNHIDCNYNGRTALHWAVYYKRLEVVKLLLNYGANTEVRSGSFNLHIIHLAVCARSLELVQLLLKHNSAWINTECSQGVTPIILAAIFGFEEIVMHLLPISEDMQGKTNAQTQQACFTMAAKYGHTKLLNALLEPSFPFPQNCIENEGLNLLHIAAANGELATVDVVFKKYPMFLNAADLYNQTPIFLAAKNGFVDVVRYLIQEGADLRQAYKNPFNIDLHGKTALDVALKNHHYAVANTLILKIYPFDDINTILSLVQSGAQALDLANQAPALSQNILQDLRIRDLILAISAPEGSNNLVWIYQTSRPRSASIITKINLNTNTFICFKPERALGKGAFGNVRLFTNETNEQIAVKSLINDLEVPITTNYAFLTQLMDKEGRIFAQVYPNANPVNIIHKAWKKNNGKLLYTNRFLMPYMKKETLKNLLPTLTDVNQIAQIILKIAMELNRIHNVHPGILHGDINSQNILIDINNHQIEIKFIDFGRAYYLTDKSVSLIDEKYRFKIWYPPELCCQEATVIKPNFSQDVYQLGYTLDYVLQMNKSYYTLTNSFPSIGNFIENAQQEKPVDRPDLPSFITALQGEVDKKMSQSITASNNRSTLWSGNKSVHIESQKTSFQNKSNY